MATDPPIQRAYRALCPNCGAPVEFRSAASASAVCSFCRSTLVRDGDALRRIGQSAELFDDHSPLQLGASGRHQGAVFTLIGRLQYAYDGGTWNEWHALFDTGASGWLSEDNGRYVIAFDAPTPPDLPRADMLRVAERRLIDGRAWDVASIVRAKLLAAEGELPRPPQLQGEFIIADLRNEQAEVATIDDSQPASPQWSVGRSVALGALQMSGLADLREKTLGARGFNCPNCGFAVAIALADTKSVVCPQCHSVIDVSQGIGADMAVYQQRNVGPDRIDPQLPLGSAASLALGGGRSGGDALPWQVVGYMERCDLPRSPGDEQTFWREYLLYHRETGFAFLVDAQDGWSWVVPVTGSPAAQGDSARYDNVDYRLQYRYDAVTTYVLGEFYWRVSRDQRGSNADYIGTGANAHKRLNREQSADEVTWSAGETIDAATVAAAFRLPQDQRGALQRDVSPGLPGFSPLMKVMIVLALLLLVVFLATQCSRNDCDSLRNTFGDGSNEYRQCMRSNHGGSGAVVRTIGGAYGGFSTGGGGHK